MLTKLNICSILILERKWCYVWRLKKAQQRLRMRIKSLIDEMHHKVAYFLTTRFNEVYIPTYETSQMVTRMNRRINSLTARNMLTLGNYRFKRFLKQKGELHSCKITEGSEAYTSKTCSYCGKIHNIGSKKQLKCSCGANVDRDLNGARGIYLRALAVTPS